MSCVCFYIDKHAPKKSVVVRRRAQSLRFDGDCRSTKRRTRQLERIHRRTRSVANHDEWTKQLDCQRSFMQSKYASYWSSAVSDCRHDSRVLWRKLDVLLRPPAPSSSIGHTADDFASFFVGKVSDITTTRTTISSHNDKTIVIWIYFCRIYCRSSFMGFDAVD